MGHAGVGRYRFQGLGVVSRDPDLSTPFGRMEGVADGCIPLLHNQNSWRNTVVNEHWDFEVAVAEQSRDVSEVHANLISRGVIMISLGVYFDDAPVSKQGEVMSSSFV